jgi:hypothetical protein
VCQQICSDQRELDEFFSKLKLTACPHCKNVGTLIRHGVLRGSGNAQQPNNSVRAYRIFCSNRDRVKGCGRTFSVWLAHKVKRLSISATQLWEFLQQVIQGGNKLAAFRSVNSELSDSAPYRIWKRFQQSQSDIRAKLFQRCHPPDSASQRATELTLDHLESAFQPHALGPIAAFQRSLQSFFV